MARTQRAWLVSVVGLVALAGCGTTGATQTPAPTSPAPEQTDPDPSEPQYSCFGPAYAQSVWEAGLPAVGVQHPGRDALQRALGEGGIDGWFVLEVSNERLTVARALTDPPDPLAPILRTHEVLSVAQHGGAWGLDQASECAPHRVAPGLGEADVRLAGPPDRTADEVHLFVTELACASGRDATGRVQVVTLEESDAVVELFIAVAPRGGAQECPGNPDTPVTITLAEPLGDRQLLDLGVWPPREIVP